MRASEPASRVRVCSADEIAEGGVLRVEVDGLPIAVVHTDDGCFFAVYDECSHAQVPLSEGEVAGCTLECWLHGARFDLRTGEPVTLPATEPVPVYPVGVRDGDVYVTMNPSNGVNR